MPLVTTTEMFKKAYDNGYAIGAFNVNNMEIVQGITSACKKLNAPVILQVSSGARKHAHHDYLVKMVEAAVAETGLPIALHLDHGPDFETCKSCIDGGFTSVMIDGSSKPYEENVELTRKVGEILRACGLNETTTFGFAAPGDLEKIGMSTEGRGYPVVLMNPLVAEQTEMRRSLLPGLLQSVAYNEAHGTPNVHLYEGGSLFHGRENASLPKETKSVAGVLSGQWSEQSWTMKYRKLRFFFGKGIVEELLAQLRIEKVRFRPVEGEGYAFLQPGRAAEVLSGGTVLGWVGEIHPEAREAMGIDEVVVAFELDLDKLIKGARNQENYREFSQYPAVEHDLAIVVDNAVTCEDLERRITSAGGKLLEGVRLFDVYRDPIRIGAGKKSMAFALTYRSDDHTLTSEEVEKAHQKIVAKVCKGVNGEVRG